MLLKYFYDEALAHASYLVGCQRSGEAVIVDPGRNIEPYLEMAEREQMRIVAAAETHIHADYVSGVRELAERVEARIYLSDEGPAEWKYQFANRYDSVLLKDGERFRIGNIEFEVMHTPGHTPESISFLLTDQGGGATKPMGIFTGDFVFVGSIGRPDLLEEAAGIVGSAEDGARQLYQSILRFHQLPDYLQVWPAHGAGSACGKGLGAIPSSTVGYEKLFNPALQFPCEEDFVRYILADQPPAPKYFAVMKRVNKEGPQLVSQHPLQMLDGAELPTAVAAGTVVDVRPSVDFAQAHVPQTINIPSHWLAAWGGWIIDYDHPLYFICGSDQVAELQRLAQKMGMDSLAGYFDVDQLMANQANAQSYADVLPKDIVEPVRNGEVTLVDVRSLPEWNAGHIAEAKHHFLGRLAASAQGWNHDKPFVLQCHAGARSAIGASMLQALGAEVMNLKGGITAWRKAGLPVVTDDARSSSPV